MHDEVQERMDLADRFLERLDRFTAIDWREIATAHTPRHEFYALALQLVSDATLLAGDELLIRYETFLADRYRRIDRIVARHTDELWDLAPLHLTVMAKAAMNAILVRDAHGFNVGAFSELAAPFRWHIGLDEGARVG